MKPFAATEHGRSTHRWYAYFTDLRGIPGLRPGFVAYLGDWWDRRRDTRLERIRL